MQRSPDVGPKTCNICGAPPSQHRLIYYKWNYPIYQCEQCLLGSSGVTEQTDVLSIYDEGYFQGARPDGYANYAQSEKPLRAEFNRTITYLRDSGPKQGRLLEVGCAYGFFLLEAQNYFDCTGIEVSQAAVDYCLQRGLNVHCDTVNAETIRNYGQFDVVVLLDVIEHLPDPAETLRLLHQIMNPGGVILISTGDWRSILARVMGKRWRLMTPPQHLFFFSPQNLAQLLEKSGFELARVEHPWKIVPFELMLYQITRRLGIQFDLGQRLGSVGFPVNLFDAMRVLAKRR